MRQLSRFLFLSPQRQALLVETSLMLSLTRLGLWLLPFRTWRHLLTEMIAGQPRPAATAEQCAIAQTIGSTVERASRYVPRATCLTQSIVAYGMLKRRGIYTRLHIGIMKNGSEHFEAHAWLKLDEQIIVGGRLDLTRFALLPNLRSGKSR